MSDSAEEFVFRFDAPVPSMLLGGDVALDGWLLHRDGKPIHGIRALVKRPWRKRTIVPARRKRKRPEIAAAFPEVAYAEESGFRIELQLGLGQNHLEFQVRDHERRWRTFTRAKVFSLPLEMLNALGLPNLRRFLIFYLAQFVSTPSEDKQQNVSLGGKPELLQTRRVEIFATSNSNLFILEIGQLVAAGFRELGLDARVRYDEVPAENPPDDAAQIVLTPHEYYNLFLSTKLSAARCKELTRGVYLLCTEQPETGWFHSNLQWAANARGLADINPLGVAAYRKRAINAHHLQLGFHPMLTAPSPRPHRERSHEITFLGSMTDRRDHFFARHADFFAQHRCHIRFVPLGFAKTATTRSYLGAEQRNALLSDSRILLNVHYSDQKYCEWHRMLVALANGCCIISETCKGHGPLVPGKHFIMVELEYLTAACDYYLARRNECEAIANAGRHFVETQLRQADACRTFLQEIEAAGTMPLQADAAAVPLSGDLKRHFARHNMRLLGRALKDDLRGESREKAADPIEVLDENARAEVIQKRAGYRARLKQQEQAKARGEAIAHFHDNDAYHGSETPRLSVIVTLYNYAQHIDECLTSATRALARLPERTEVVIVNDASTDDSLSCALHSQGRATVPIRIVDKKFNTGLADARNMGIEVARAPFVFMLDADNLVFPDAFAQLLATISSGSYAAAYSLLARFRKTPDRRIGLLSYYDWDPQVLVQHPYIDAMAMFRRETLVSLGGYDNRLSQIGWFGWEDYEMWLRFAERDLPVAFVPNTLCLYRHHEQSMINSTNLFERDLVAFLMKRFSKLVDRYERRDTLFGIARKELADQELKITGSASSL